MLFCKKKKKRHPLYFFFFWPFFFWHFQLFKKVAYFLKVNLFKKHKKVQKSTIKVQNFGKFPGKIVKKYCKVLKKSWKVKGMWQVLSTFLWVCFFYLWQVKKALKALKSKNIVFLMLVNKLVNYSMCTLFLLQNLIQSRWFCNEKW